MGNFVYANRILTKSVLGYMFNLLCLLSSYIQAYSICTVFDVL